MEVTPRFCDNKSVAEEADLISTPSLPVKDTPMSLGVFLNDQSTPNMQNRYRL